jgi:2-oxo-4-hydroxy-4-carboxy-5-ureidoimidazoline decarboxylase
MTLTVGELDALAAADAASTLAACCGSSRWVSGMLARRPFHTREGVLTAADTVARELEPNDWLEAFSHHPRIGEQKAAAPVDHAAREWSEGEQSTAMSSEVSVRERLREANRAYEARFGFIFIICASGRPATGILAAVESRMNNVREVEILTAAREQQLITRLRLNKLLSGD